MDGHSTQHDLPVSAAGGHTEAGRQAHDFRALQRHQAEQLRKSHVVTDGHADFAQLRVRHHPLIAGKHTVGFLTAAARPCGHVTKMDLAVFGRQGAVRRIEHGGVVRLMRVFADLLDGAGMYPKPVPFRCSRHSSAALTAGNGFTVIGGICPHAVHVFRKYDEPRALFRSLRDHGFGFCIVFRKIIGRCDLRYGNGNLPHTQSPLSGAAILSIRSIALRYPRRSPQPYSVPQC